MWCSRSWLCQIAVELPTRVDGNADDFTMVVDRAGGHQIQWSGPSYQTVEIHEHSVLPQKCTNDAEIGVGGEADDPAGMINAKTDTVGVTVDLVLDGAEVAHLRCGSPQERMRCPVAAQIRTADHLITIVDAVGEVV